MHCFVAFFLLRFIILDKSDLKQTAHVQKLSCVLLCSYPVRQWLCFGGVAERGWKIMECLPVEVVPEVPIGWLFMCVCMWGGVYVS